MFRFSKTQVVAFAACEMQRFEDDLVDHLRAHFDLHRRVIGVDGLRRSARYSLERAGRRGCVSERDITLYATLALMLGAHLDDDSQLPWAQEILDGPGAISARMDELSDAALVFFEDMAGEGGQEVARAIERARRVFEGELPSIAGPEARREDQLVQLFADLFPSKARCIGEAPLRRGVMQSVDRARRYGLEAGVGAVVFATAAFMFGAGFDRDPVFSELGDVLSNTSLTGPDAKSEALRGAWRRLLARWADGLARPS